MTRARLIMMAIAWLAVVSAGSLTGWLGGRMWSEHDQKRDLGGEALRLLEKVELSIDHAITELTELRLMSVMACDSEALFAARDMLLTRATFKDISVFGPDGKLRCRANAANLGETRPPTIEAEGVASGFRFGLPDGMPEGILSVRWLSGDDGSLSANIGLDTFLYSFFPAEYRDQSSISIYLANRHVLASYGDPRVLAASPEDSRIARSSSRYPVAVRLSVPQAAIHAISARDAWLPATIGGLIAAVMASFGVWLAVRPKNPVETLKAAIADGAIVPYFQPVVKTRGGEVSGCEVLARWVGPDGRIVPPDRFIPLAESSGHICALTERLMRDALGAIEAHMVANPGFKVAFNISPVHFLKDGFQASILRLCADADFPLANLVLELTERQNLTEFAKASDVAAALREAGIRISIDDVGTGHNGLSTLQDLPGDIIKIDKRFVDTVVDNPLSGDIIAMLASLARQLGRTTVAEGVETEGQLLAMAARGIDEVQGYLFSKPLPAEAFLEWCAAHEAAVVVAPTAGPHIRSAA
jgi:sensor c-di-GMP phosphodiesterase-like protein